MVDVVSSILGGREKVSSLDLQTNGRRTYFFFLTRRPKNTVIIIIMGKPPPPLKRPSPSSPLPSRLGVNASCCKPQWVERERERIELLPVQNFIFLSPHPPPLPSSAPRSIYNLIMPSAPRTDHEGPNRAKPRRAVPPGRDGAGTERCPGPPPSQQVSTFHRSEEGALPRLRNRTFSTPDISLQLLF